ncbi:sensor histidine kinase [Zooshikella sp. RANM57]|uniref:sensor histidine kinase n=1 Tax=Zooshikella sp. RANM57 TaxID=3425863 RepID=UPI003D6E402A
MAHKTDLEQAGTLKDDFFLPDLCTTKAVFLLVLLAELIVFVWVLALPQEATFDWNRLALASFFVQWIVLVSAALLCWLRAWLAKKPLWLTLACCYSIVVFVTVTFALAAEWALYLPRGFQPFWQGIDFTKLGKHVLLAVILASLFLRYFYVHQQLYYQQQAELQARLQALQSRIHPHFLFNSLNSIASLIVINPDKAEQAVEDLAGLLRATLDDVTLEVTLQREVEICQQYTRIEQHRFGERLTVNWHMNGVPMDLPIPLLTIQPILENAILHGIQPIPDGGVIEVTLEYLNGLLILRVVNPLAMYYQQQPGKGNRLALANIQARLQALYGYRAQLSASKSDNMFVTELKYPCQPGVEAGRGE